MKTFEEWLVGESDRVKEEMNVTARELLSYLANRDVLPEEQVLFFMMGALQAFEEMTYDQKLKYIDNMVRKYKKEYYRDCRNIKVIKGGMLL